MENNKTITDFLEVVGDLPFITPSLQTCILRNGKLLWKLIKTGFIRGDIKMNGGTKFMNNEDCWFVGDREMSEDDWEIIAKVDGLFYYFSDKGEKFELVPIPVNLEYDER